MAHLGFVVRLKLCVMELVVLIAGLLARRAARPAGLMLLLLFEVPFQDLLAALRI